MNTTNYYKKNDELRIIKKEEGKMLLEVYTPEFKEGDIQYFTRVSSRDHYIEEHKNMLQEITFEEAKSIIDHW